MLELNFTLKLIFFSTLTLIYKPEIDPPRSYGITFNVLCPYLKIWKMCFYETNKNSAENK